MMVALLSNNSGGALRPFMAPCTYAAHCTPNYCRLMFVSIKVRDGPSGASKRSAISTSTVCAVQGSQASTEARTQFDGVIEGLNKEYCDDFVCTSSPAVEATVRALSRDIRRGNGVWTRTLFARNVKYRGFGSFKGPDGYQKLNFVPKYVSKDRTIDVMSMRMVQGSDTAEIVWQLTGKIQKIPIDVLVTTRITMNLLTGQIMEHVDTWDLTKSSAPGSLVFSLATAGFALMMGGSSAVETTNSMLDSLTSVDEEQDKFMMPNPNDPMKFFQQKDTFRDDAIFFIGALLLLYTMAQAWGTLFSS